MPARSKKPKPVILLSARHTVNRGRKRPEQTRMFAAYYDAVTAAGGLPVIAPPVSDENDVERLLDLADGVLFTGGYDLRARTFGETNHPEIRPMTRRREAFELALARAALARPIPILAICLGIQAVNVAAGGSLHQHVRDALGTAVQHRAGGVPEAHSVILKRGSLAARVMGAARVMVNSTHHQAVSRVGEGLVVSGRSETDECVEVLESKQRGRFLLAVQWHPERLTDRPQHFALFRALVAACGVRGNS